MDNDIQIMQSSANIMLVDLPPSARNVAAWAEIAGMEVRQAKSVVKYPPVLYVSSSDSHAIGEVRTPEKEKTHYWVQARLIKNNQKVVSFAAHWTDNSFTEALTYDVVGTPKELYFEYGIPRQNHLYNDATYYNRHHNLLTKDGDFKTWIADWAGILGVEPLTIRKKKAPKVDPYSSDINILQSLEWQA